MRILASSVEHLHCALERSKKRREGGVVFFVVTWRGGRIPQSKSVYSRRSDFDPYRRLDDSYEDIPRVVSYEIEQLYGCLVL